MLRKIIAEIFSSSIEALLWLNLVVFTFGGGFVFYNYAENTHFAPLALLGAVLGLILGIILDIIVGGFICVLLDMHNSLRNVEIILTDMNARDDIRFQDPQQYGGFGQITSSLNTENDTADDGNRGQAVRFPRVMECPNCHVELRIIHPGRFRCSKCSDVFTAEANGNVIFDN